MDLAKKLEARMIARDPQGKCFPLPTGTETVEELREMIIFFCQACPAGQNHLHCPFRTMSGLSYHAMTGLVKNLPHQSCLNLFELEFDCRSREDSSCHPHGGT
jgi:hypothetical protein